MTIKEKILSYLDIKGIKRNEFFESLGIAPSNFKGAAKASELGGDKIAKILTCCPDLSADWLLTGEGTMLKTKCLATLPPASNIEDTYRNDSKGTDIPANTQALGSEIIDKLLSTINNKDTTIRELSEEIGRLKEQIRQLTIEKESLVSAARSSGAAKANVG